MDGYFPDSPRVCTHTKRKRRISIPPAGLNPLCQQPSGRRPTPEIARSPEWYNLFIYLLARVFDESVRISALYGD